MKALVVFFTNMIIALTIHAQTFPNVEANTPDGELAIYILAGEATSEISVILNLDGAVYNDVGEYRLWASTSNPMFNEYETNYLYGSELTLFDPNDDSPNDGQWESVYTDDEAADPEECPGMVGWGEYKLEFECASSTEHLYINTIDGNWMDPRYGNGNKIVIAVALESIGGGNYDFVFYLYDWNAESWSEVSNNSSIYIWDQLNETRNRAVINVLEDAPFTWDETGGVPYIVNDIVVDYYIAINDGVPIAAGKAVIFTDYDELPTYVSFDEDASFGVYGTLVSQTNVMDADYYCVYFQPKEEKEYPYTRASWQGVSALRTTNVSGIAVDLEKAYLCKAVIGVCSPHNSGWISIDDSKIENCELGVYVNNAMVYINNSEINGCGDGVVLRGYLYGETPSLIYNSYIHHNYPVTGYGKGAGVRVGRDQEWPPVPYRPEQSVRIVENRINYNWLDGISCTQHYAAIYNNEIAHNGYRWGVLWGDLEDNEKYSGVHSERSWCIAHENTIMFNSWAGIHVDGQKVECASIDDDEGLNCLDGNGYNLSAGGSGIIFAGNLAHDHQGNVITINNRNSTKWPKEVTTTVAPAHAIAREDAIILLRNNYFIPFASNCWVEESGGWVNVDDMITNPNDAVCPEGTGGTGSGQTYPTDNENVKSAVYCMARDTLVDSIWYYASRAMSGSLNEIEMKIALECVVHCYVYGGISAAEDSLDMYAYNTQPADSSRCSMALRKLIVANLWTLEAQDVIKACDTLKSRQLEWYGYYDTLYYKMSLANNALWVNEDTAQAITLLNEILEMDSLSRSAKRLMYLITGDTTYVASNKAMDKKYNDKVGVKRYMQFEMTVYPNPATNCLSIVIKSEKERVISIGLYTITGEKVLFIHGDVLQIGTNYVELETTKCAKGSYYCVVTDRDEVLSSKVVSIK